MTTDQSNPMRDALIAAYTAGATEADSLLSGRGQRNYTKAAIDYADEQIGATPSVADEARAREVLASIRAKHSQSALCFTSEDSVIAAMLAFATPAPERDDVGGLVEAADYLIDRYRRLWLGERVRDLDEASVAYDVARAALQEARP